jgi:hypothetical protein
VTALVFSGSAWYQLAVVLGLAAVYPLRRAPRRALAASALNRFYGVVIAVMATGHLVAGSIACARGSLSASATPWLLYAVGIAMLVPATALAVVARRLQRTDGPPRRTALALNGWLIAVLVAPLASAPLAAPAIANMVAIASSRRRTQQIAVRAAIALYAAMLLASLLVDESGF